MMGSVIVHAPLLSLNLPSLHIGFYYVNLSFTLQTDDVIIGTKRYMDPHELLRVVQGRMGYDTHPLYKNLPFSSVAK